MGSFLVPSGCPTRRAQSAASPEAQRLLIDRALAPCATSFDVSRWLPRFHRARPSTALDERLSGKVNQQACGIKLDVPEEGVDASAGQVGMHQMDGDRTFPNGRGDPFDRQ